MTALYRREFHSYFRHFKGYLFLALFYLFSGTLFIRYNILVGSGDLKPLFSKNVVAILFLIPLLTMDSFAKDQKNGIYHVLYSAPISRRQWVSAKFLAAWSVFGLGVFSYVWYGWILNYFQATNWAYISGNIFATLLLGGALLAMGQCASLFTTRPWVAAFIYYSLVFVMISADLYADTTTNSFFSMLVGSLSLPRQYFLFTAGIFSIPIVFFYLGVIVLFLFLSVRMLEHRRWKEDAV